MKRGRHKAPWSLGGRLHSVLALILYLVVYSLVMAIVLPPREPLNAQPPTRTVPDEYQDLLPSPSTASDRIEPVADEPGEEYVRGVSMYEPFGSVIDPATGEPVLSTHCLTYEVDCPTTTTMPVTTTEPSTTSTSLETTTTIEEATTTTAQVTTTTRATTTTSRVTTTTPSTTTTTAPTTTTTTMPVTTTTEPEEG